MKNYLAKDQRSHDINMILATYACSMIEQAPERLNRLLAESRVVFEAMTPEQLGQQAEFCGIDDTHDFEFGYPFGPPIAVYR